MFSNLEFTAFAGQPLPSPSESQRLLDALNAVSSNMDDFDEDDDGLSDSDLLAVENTPCKSREVIVIKNDKEDEDEDLWKSRVPNAPPINFTRSSPETDNTDYGEDVFEGPDFDDPTVITALEVAAKKAIPCEASAPVPTIPPQPMITIAQLDFQAALRAAFAAGRESYNATWRRQHIFRFLALPAELRLGVYKFALQDTNSKTKVQDTMAFPDRIGDTISWSTNWSTHKKQRPHIPVALLRVCKQIHAEIMRDKFLYRKRPFKAIIEKFDKRLLDFGHGMSFWQHMQHLHLDLSYRLNVRGQLISRGIDHLIACLRGGISLRSFKMVYDMPKYLKGIYKFEDLWVRGAISITQVFDDRNSEAGKKNEDEREQGLQNLMLKMRRLPVRAIPKYDVIVSEALDALSGRSILRIAIETDGKEDLAA